MKRQLKFLIFTTLITASFSAAAQTKYTEATDFTLVSTEGVEVNLFDAMADGKTVLLSFFYTGCGNCVLDAPKVDSIYRQFGSGEEQLLVWGIANPFDGVSDVENFILETEVTYPCFTTGHADDVFAYYEILYTPQIYIVCDYTVSESISFFEIVENLDYCFPTKINKIEVYPNIHSKNKKLYINNVYQENSNVGIYDITGKLIKSISLSPNEETVVNNLNPNNIFIVRTVSESGQMHAEKIFLK